VFKAPGQKNIAGMTPAYTFFDRDKPVIYFDHNIDIKNCNEIFLKQFNAGLPDFPTTNLSDFKLNDAFIDAIRKAFDEGISTFRGHVLFDRSTAPEYLDAVLIRHEAIDEISAETIACIVTNNRTDKHSILNPSGFAEASPGYQNASITLYSLDGSAIYISHTVESLIGYTSEELIGMNPLDFVHPDDLAEVDAIRGKLNAENTSVHAKFRLLHRNGTVVFVESSNYYIAASPGRAAHVVSVTWDQSTQAVIQLALERSEQKYYRLVMNLPTGISLISPNGQLLEVNDAMKQIMGIPDGSPMPEINFFTVETMKQFNIHLQLQKCIETKEIVNGELSVQINGNKQGKFLSYSFVPVYKKNKELDVIIGYVTDHTQQLKAETENRERADFLNLVINAINAPFFVKDRDHKWIMLNNAAVEMMGHSRDMLIGKSDYDIYPKQQADIFWKFDELVFKSGSSINEEQITWSDGSTHTIVTNKQLYIENSTGKKFIVGTIHDVSGYKKIEDELRASEHKYHELFDNANDYIITLDLDGHITNANRTLLNYLKSNLHEITKHNIFEYIHKDHLASAYASRDKILEGGYNDPFEIIAIGANKQEVTFEVKASPMFHNGHLVGIQCVLSDVTLRKQATEKLEKYTQDLLDLNKTKDKFFSIIAHDLRNPYSSMIGFSEMLLEDLDQLTKDEIRESLKIIHTSAKHSFTLLDNLLAWSRLETGHMPFSPSRIVLIDAVEEVNNVLFSLAYRKKIEINNRVSPDILLYADKNMLNTILNNLIMNAIKYTASGGQINISAEKIKSRTETIENLVSVSVSDNGVGIEAEILDILFTEKKMVSQPGTEKEQGTGLGLLLTREMIEKHGGNISVKSTPGKGSVFTFLLPAFIPAPMDADH